MTTTIIDPDITDLRQAILQKTLNAIDRMAGAALEANPDLRPADLRVRILDEPDAVRIQIVTPKLR